MAARLSRRVRSLQTLVDVALLPYPPPGERGISRYVAASGRIFEKHGLETHTHSWGTNVEGAPLRASPARRRGASSSRAVRLTRARAHMPDATRFPAPGEWDAVMRAVRECHENAHALGCERVVSSWRVETGDKAGISSTMERLSTAQSKAAKPDE